MSKFDTVTKKSADAKSGQDVSERIRTMADTIKSNAEIDDNGVITIDKEVFKKTLPDEVSEKQVKSVFNHTDDLTAAVTLATGEMGEQFVKKNKNSEKVSSTMRIGNQAKVGAEWRKSKTGPKSVQERDTQVTRFGVTRPYFRVNSDRDRGELKKVKAHLKERAENLFG